MPWLEHDTDCPNAQACENRFKFVSAQHQYVSKKDENDKVGPLQRCRKLVVVPAHSAGSCWILLGLWLVEGVVLRSSSSNVATWSSSLDCIAYITWFRDGMVSRGTGRG